MGRVVVDDQRTARHTPGPVRAARVPIRRDRARAPPSCCSGAAPQSGARSFALSPQPELARAAGSGTRSPSRARSRTSIVPPCSSDDAARHEQAEAGPLPARLGGVERLEDPLERVRRDAGARCPRPGSRRRPASARVATRSAPPCGIASQALTNRSRNARSSRSPCASDRRGLAERALDLDPALARRLGDQAQRALRDVLDAQRARGLALRAARSSSASGSAASPARPAP